MAMLWATVGLSQVNSKIDSASVRIGEEIKYSISVLADSTDVVVFPDGQTFLPLEMIEAYKTDTTFEQAKFRLLKKYGLTQFDSGRYTIPKQKVLINDRLFETDLLEVEIRAVAVDTLKQKMFDIKPAVEISKPPFDFLKLLYWLLPLLVIGFLVFIFLRGKKRKAAEELKLPPYEEAIVALKKLDSSSFLKENKGKEYYSQLTEIVKRYLDREVDSAALESTSDELIQRLQMHKDAGHFDFNYETIEQLDKILKRDDLVKFAKMQQMQGQAETDRETVEAIINETHEAVPEPSEEELLENELYKEKIRKKKIRKNWILGIFGAVGAVLLAGIIYGSIAGFANLKDFVFGNELRDLTEGQWFSSEYGNPAIILETPKVLVRTETSNDSVAENRDDVFSFGSLEDPFFVKVSSVQFQQPQNLELETALEAALVTLEKDGAKNLIVKQEPFETDKGITGIKAFGEFNVQVSGEKMKAERSKYELLLFLQQNGMQKILIVYQDDGAYAEKIKDRILNSVELEISEKP